MPRSHYIGASRASCSSVFEHLGKLRELQPQHTAQDIPYACQAKTTDKPGTRAPVKKFSRDLWPPIAGDSCGASNEFDPSERCQ